MNKHVVTAVLVVAMVLCVPVAAGSAGDLKEAELSLIQALQKLQPAGLDSTGLQTDCRILISKQEDGPFRYLFTLSLGTGGRFRCDVSQSPNGPLTIGAPGDGSVWVHLPRKDIVLLTVLDQLKGAAGGGAPSVEEWVIGLRDEIRLERASSTVSEAVVFLPRRPDVAELEDIKRVVLWLDRKTRLPRRLLIYDREYQIRAQVEVTSSWNEYPVFPETFFRPPEGQQTRQIDCEGFFAALVHEERLFAEESR